MDMGRTLMLLLATCLALASGTNASVKKGDVEIEIQGGWLMQSAQEGDIDSSGSVIDYSEVLSGATGADLDSWFVGASLGLFTSRNFQIAVTGFYTQMDGDAETFEFIVDPEAPAAEVDFDLDLDVWGIGGRARWHFSPGKKLVPYVGAQVLWVTADIDVEASAAPGYEALFPTETESGTENGILWGPIVGLRYQLDKKLEAIVEYQYHMWSGDIGDILDDGHAISAGLCIKLN
jgi:hypothetical protein